MLSPPSARSKSFVINHVKYTNLSIELCRVILKSIGAWPLPLKASVIEKCIYFFTNATFYSLLALILIPSVLYVAVEVEDSHLRFQLIGPLSYVSLAILKYLSVSLRTREIRECAEWIESDWKNVTSFADMKIMIENAMYGRKIIKICAVFMLGGSTFFYLAKPLSTGKVLAEENFTYWPLTYPVARFLLDARRSPVNEIFSVIQCVTGFLGNTITVGACSLAAALAMHAYGQLELLMSWLTQLVEGGEESSDSVDERLAQIIQQHVRIFGFITLTKKIVNAVSFFEILASTSSMCFLEYLLITDWENSELTDGLTHFTLMISITFNIFIFCYIGQQLTDQFKKVGKTSYMIEWYRLPGKKSLCLVIVISMSNAPVKFTAGNIFELSYRFFGDVVKTSVVYMNMIRQVG